MRAIVVSNQSCNQNADSKVTTVKPSIEPIETILVSKIDEMKAMTAAKNIEGLYSNKTPTEVATALPPLKPIHIENVWPRIAPNPTTMKAHWGDGPQILAIKAPNIPLHKSIIKTIVPGTGPNVLKVLVVPIFPEPNSKIFFL